MKSIWFRNKYVYYLGEFILHGRNYKKRFELISKLIGKNKVLDLGSGLCTLYYFIKSDYEGWDLNKYFVKTCRKKGINVKLKDCFDLNSNFNVIVLSDILHHVAPRESELLKLALKHGKKVIVCEGFKDYGNKFYWFARNLRIKLGLENLIGENDGINDPKKIRILERPELYEFFKSHGKCKIEIIGRTMIAIY